jgi:hypothetical protein
VALFEKGSVFDTRQKGSNRMNHNELSRATSQQDQYRMAQRAHLALPAEGIVMPA